MIPALLQPALMAKGPDYKAMATKVAKEYGVDPDLFHRLIAAESSWNPNIVSRAGAIGLGQLMPGTAKALGVDPRNPEQNLRGAAKYLSQQLKAFGGNVSHALAAYNAGPGAVRKYHGVPPYKETRNYVAKILNGYKSARAAGARPQAVSLPNPLTDIVENGGLPPDAATEPPVIPGAFPFAGVGDLVASASPDGAPSPEQDSVMAQLDEAISSLRQEIQSRTERRDETVKQLTTAISAPRPDIPLPDAEAGMDHKTTGALALGSAALGLLGVDTRAIGGLVDGFTRGRATAAAAKDAKAQKQYQQDAQSREDVIGAQKASADLQGDAITAADKRLADAQNDKFRLERDRETSRSKLQLSLFNKLNSPTASIADKQGALAALSSQGVLITPEMRAAANQDGGQYDLGKQRVAISADKNAVERERLSFAKTKWKDEYALKKKDSDARIKHMGDTVSLAQKRINESARQFNRAEDRRGKELALATWKAAHGDQAKVVADIEKEIRGLDAQSKGIDASITEINAQITTASAVPKNESLTERKSRTDRVSKLKEKLSDLKQASKETAGRKGALESTLAEGRKALEKNRPPEIQ